MKDILINVVSVILFVVFVPLLAAYVLLDIAVNHTKTVTEGQ